MTENLLNPCPFCGSESFIFDVNDDGIAVECNGCLAHGPRATDAYGAEQEWNRRAEDGNGKKEEGRKELKAEILAHLMEQKTKVKGLCHAHVVELMQFVEGL